MQDKAKRTSGHKKFLSEFRENTQRRCFREDDGRSEFLQEASATWRRLSQGEKASYGMRARGMNCLRSRSAGSLEEEELGADDSGGLWGMCRLNEGWPICVAFFKLLWEKGVQH